MDRKQQGLKRTIQEATVEITPKKIKVETYNKVSYIRLAKESLNLKCMWNSCGVRSNSWEEFDKHLTGHVEIYTERSTCLWVNCSYNASVSLLKQHLSYHGYISKLCSIGQSIVKRRGLPECKQQQVSDIIIKPLGYTCKWKNCLMNFNTIYDFLNHLVMHVKNVEKSEDEKYDCDWRDCRTSYSNRANLAVHLRVHSKEKLVACPTCFIPLSNRTTLINHRIRQQCGNNYTCSECPQTFPSERLRREHVRFHLLRQHQSQLAEHINAIHSTDRSEYGELHINKVIVGNGEKARMIKSEGEKLEFSVTGENEWNPSPIREEGIDTDENVLKIESEEKLHNLEFNSTDRIEFEEMKKYDTEENVCKIEWEGKLLNLEFNLTDLIEWEEMENDERKENVCMVGSN